MTLVFQKKMLRLMTLVVRFLSICILFFSCLSKNTTLHSIYGNAQGTFYSVQYFSNQKSIFKSDLDSLLLDLDLSLSSYIDSSSISRINNNATIKIDNYLKKVITRSLKICKETNGAFDITVAPIVNAYGFGPKKNSFKTDGSYFTEYIGCDKIFLENDLIQKEESIQLDVNGIAQGFSVDVLSNFLKENGIVDFIINIGGEIFCSGDKKGKPWLVAIEQPLKNIQSQKYILKLSNTALATSGSYRKIKELENKVISHTINPKTFKPIENQLLSVSIMSENCMDADAYATACMSMGLEKSKNFVKKRGIEACFIYKDRNDTLTYMTSGLLSLVSSDSPDFLDLQSSLGDAPQ